MADSTIAAGYLHHPMRRTDLHPGGGQLRLRAIGHHQHHHRRGNHPLHHRRQHPEETAGTLYNSAVNISANYTLQAIAYETGMADSPVTSGIYTIQCAAPSFTPAAGSYGSAQSVTISTTTGGATIRYTTDGSTPTETAGTRL